MGLDQREQVLRFVQDGVRADDEVRVRAQSSVFGRGGGGDVQNVPDVLVGALERAEADGDAKKALAAPQVAWGDEDFADL